jgi:acetolactate synthase-1/2/3 large subunit
VTARTGADLLIDAIKASGVDCVFGMPGTQVVPIFESLRERQLRVVVPTHELAAGFMAMGYARASSPVRPGVVITIPGPGFTYALTPLAEAKLDGVPMIHVTLMPTKGPEGGPGFQAIDQATMARPLVKEIIEVPDANGVTAGVERAMALALAAPRGPVLLHLAARALGDLAGGTPGGGAVGPAFTEARSDWGDVLTSLRQAERPVVLVTGDCDAAGLAALAARDRVPVCVTPAARGAVPDDHLWGLCFDDQRTSLSTLNEFLGQTDALVVLGSQLSHVATAGYELAIPEQRMTWVRAAPGAGEGHYLGARQVTGDPQDLLEAWRRDESGGPWRSQWTEAALQEWRTRLAGERVMALPEPKVRGVSGGSSAALFAGFRQALPRNAIVVTDSGMHQVLTRRYLDVFESGGLLLPSDFQSMGFGIPAGIGAQLAAPRRPVVAVVGDGGFAMTGFEMLTAVREGVSLVVVVFNDGRLNLIRLQQLREYGREHGVDVPEVDFEGFARAAGLSYFEVDGDPARTMREALDAGAPALVEVRLGDSAAVFRTKVSRLAKQGVMRLLGPSLVKWLKGRFQ